MLNLDLVQIARKNLEHSVTQHWAISKLTLAQCTQLYQLRKHTAHDLVCEVEQYVNTMKTTPENFAKVAAEYKVNFSAFAHVIVDFDLGVKDIKVKSSAGVGAGTAAGAATAFMGPTAAMAIATTFGTASTGTAISTLGGAAATNAALAWLGGGAIAAGGGGISAGGALLGLAGPIGWGLAAISVVGGAAYMRTANEKIAKEAGEKQFAVEAEIRSLEASKKAITGLQDLTEKMVRGLYLSLVKLRDELKVTDYKDQPDDIIEKFAAMTNNVRSLGELLVKTIDLKTK